MKTAEQLYNQESIEDQAKRLCVGMEEVIIGGVEYVIYEFKDGSKLRLGNNGFIGCEV